MQPQESTIQQQKAGLVHKHTRELARPKSLCTRTVSASRHSAPSWLEASTLEEGHSPARQR